MDGALMRDLLQACALFFAEKRAFQVHGAFDAMDEAVGGRFTLGAVARVDALLSETHFDAFERPVFAPCVEHEGHRDATAKRGE